jgi:hypothetical protein
MKRSVLALLALSAGACASARTTYAPVRVAPAELTLRYDDGFEIWSAKGKLTSGPRYQGLTDFVRCVPDAERHARDAESAGASASLLSGFSIGFAVAGLGGLGGLAYLHKDDTMMEAFLISGLVLEVAAIALGASSLAARSHAHGNALDAVNFYNDAVGFERSGCPGH